MTACAIWIFENFHFLRGKLQLVVVVVVVVVVVAVVVVSVFPYVSWCCSLTFLLLSHAENTGNLLEQLPYVSCECSRMLIAVEFARPHVNRGNMK